jgi:hypothetical protein
MHTLVVYESMYGNTHAVADAVGLGLQPTGEVRVVAVTDVSPDMVAWADLVIAGGPTHDHGMASAKSRESARETAAKPEAAEGWELRLTLDPAAAGPGVREWLEALGPGGGKRAAAFDTRVKAPAFLTGRASSGIAKRLRGRGFRLVAEPESFLVDSHNKLVPGEIERAMRWASSLAATLVPMG